MQDKEGRAGKGKYTMCMTQPAVHTDSSNCPRGRSSNRLAIHRATVSAHGGF